MKIEKKFFRLGIGVRIFKIEMVKKRQSKEKEN